MSLYRSHLARVARHRWPRIKRILPWAVLTLAVGLLAYFGSSVDWPGVWQAVRRIPRQTLLLAAALVPPAYLAYAALDLQGVAGIAPTQQVQGRISKLGGRTQDRNQKQR